MSKTARQELAEVLTWYFGQGQINERRLRGRIRRCKPEHVRGWLDGTRVPSSDEWNSMRGIARGLAASTDLWRRARTEQDEEQSAVRRALEHRSNMAPQNDRPPAHVGVNVGEQIRKAQQNTPDAATRPAPTSESAPTGPKSPGQYAHASRQLGIEPPGTYADGRAAAPPRPVGSMSSEARAKRLEFVRGILQQRPHAPASGDDGVIALVRRTFGVGIDPGAVEQIRKEMETERLEARMREKILADMQPAIVVPAAAVPTGPPVLPAADAPARPLALAEVNEGDVVAGVEMLVAAIPGLLRLVVTVDEQGEPSYEYEVREVRTRSGGGRVRR